MNPRRNPSAASAHYFQARFPHRIMATWPKNCGLPGVQRIGRKHFGYDSSYYHWWCQPGLHLSSFGSSLRSVPCCSYQDSWLLWMFTPSNGILGTEPSPCFPFFLHPTSRFPRWFPRKFLSSSDPDPLTFSIWHIFWLSMWHSVWHFTKNMFWNSNCLSVWHLVWHIFWHSV